jgi:DNA-directed RNA polymerase subunit beta'
MMQESFNPIYMMADSGARGSKDQMRQLGRYARPDGQALRGNYRNPDHANFREGLTVLQYFISTHGARKGLADTALKTANSGYLTRRLADVAQDCTVTEEDCGTMMGVEVEPLMEGGEVIQRLGERVLGRTAIEDIVDPFTDEVLDQGREEIDEDAVVTIENAGITSVKIRSVLTCKAKYGGLRQVLRARLSHGRTVENGQAIGIWPPSPSASPGTQLTMRTFHIGGTASRRVEQADIRARVDGAVKFINLCGQKRRQPERGHEPARRRVLHQQAKAARAGAFSGDLRRTPAGPRMVRCQGGRSAGHVGPFHHAHHHRGGGDGQIRGYRPGKTMQEKVDPVTGKSSRTIIESKSRRGAAADLHQER